MRGVEAQGVSPEPHRARPRLQGHIRGPGWGQGLRAAPAATATAASPHHWLATTARRTPARKEVAVSLFSPVWGSAHHHPGAGRPEWLRQVFTSVRPAPVYILPVLLRTFPLAHKGHPAPARAVCEGCKYKKAFPCHRSCHKIFIQRAGS